MLSYAELIRAVRFGDAAFRTVRQDLIAHARERAARHRAYPDAPAVAGKNITGAELASAFEWWADKLEGM